MTNANDPEEHAGGPGGMTGAAGDGSRPLLDQSSAMIDAVVRLERAVVRLQNQRLRPWDLTLSSYVALRVLHDRPELSLAQLARRCYSRPQTMTRIVSHLEARGFVARGANPDSERAVSLVLTDQGTTALAEMTEEVDKVNESLGRVLDEGQVAVLNETLRSCALLLESELRELSKA